MISVLILILRHQREPYIIGQIIRRTMCIAIASWLRLTRSGTIRMIEVRMGARDQSCAHQTALRLAERFARLQMAHISMKPSAGYGSLYRRTLDASYALIDAKAESQGEFPNGEGA